MWGVSFDDTQSTVSIEERQARRNLRVESRLLLRQKEALARQQQLMTTSLRGARMATANGGDGPAGGPEIQTRGGLDLEDDDDNDLSGHVDDHTNELEDYYSKSEKFISDNDEEYKKQFRRDWRRGGVLWVWYAKGGDGTGAPIRAKVRSKVKDKGASRVKRSKHLELWELFFNEVDEEGNKVVGYYDCHFWRIFSLKKDCKLYCQEGME